MIAGHGISVVSTYQQPPQDFNNNWHGISFINLLNSKVAINSFPNALSCNQRIFGIMGPVADSNGGGLGVDFPGQSTVSDARWTAAAITLQSASGGNFPTISNNSNKTTGGFRFGPSNSGQGLIVFDTVGNYSLSNGPVMTFDNPTFIAASCDSLNSIINYAQLDLITGKGYFARETGQTMNMQSATTGTYCVYGGTGSTLGDNAAHSVLACAMWSPAYLALQELQKWAYDPWAFWYPHV